MTRRRAAAGLLVLLGAFSQAAWTHVAQGIDIRVVHFEHAADGLYAYYRLSLALVVGAQAGAVRPDGSFNPPPFMLNRLESGLWFHYVDSAHIKREVSTLGGFIAAGHRLLVAGQPLTPRVLAVRVHPKGLVPRFDSLAEAQQAVVGAPWPDAAPAEVEASYALVDTLLFYPHPGGVERFQLASDLSGGPVGQPEIITLVIDHTAQGDAFYRLRGPLVEPISVNPEAAAQLP